MYHFRQWQLKVVSEITEEGSERYARTGVREFKKWVRTTFHADRIRSAQLHDVSPDRTAGSRIGRRQLASHDRIPGATRVLKGRRTHNCEGRLTGTNGTSVLH
jgi:hypothetical protein